MALKHTVKLTANFERNLEDIEQFLMAAAAPLAFDALLDELADTLIPNLERFPRMGRLFLERQAHSVEVTKDLERLSRQLSAINPDGEIREYLLSHYLRLYALIDGTVHLLSIRHERQLSFDFVGLWPRG